MSVAHSAVLGYGWLVYDKAMIDAIEDVLLDDEQYLHIMFESINVYDKNAPFFFGVSLATSYEGAVIVDEVEENSAKLIDCVMLLERNGILEIMNTDPQVYLIQECW